MDASLQPIHSGKFSRFAILPGGGQWAVSSMRPMPYRNPKTNDPVDRYRPRGGAERVDDREERVEKTGLYCPLFSKLIGGEDFTTGSGREGLEDFEDDQLLDESDTAVGKQEVGAAGMKRPVLVAVGQA
jgi:hypothetical protein